MDEELEQLRVTAEDAREEATALAAERDALAAELAHRTARLRETELRLQRREEAAKAARAALPLQAALDDRMQATEQSAATEELRVAMEELQVLAEELEESNTALAQANAELERRVEARTAELAALNARLRDSEERLRLAQRHAGAATWDWDIAANRFTWSEEYFDLCGLDPRTATPSRDTWLESVLAKDRKGVAAALEICLRHRDPDFQAEYRIRHSRRGERWLASRGRLVCDEHGDPVRLIGLNIDITDRKQAELALAETNETLRQEMAEEVKAREAAQARLFQAMKLEALGQLTGGIAHDFNNLLCVIVSGISLMRRSEDPVRRESLLGAMEQAAHRGSDLTRRLLTFARRQSLRPEPLDLRAWLEDMRELLARSLRGDIMIEIAAPEDLWPALADPGELELAVLNLAVNARDAMPKGGTLRLSAANAELDGLSDPDGLEGPFLHLSVQDDGTGMTPEVLERAFEPFFSTKEMGRGTGLGLAQVYGFARQSGGAARASSTPGQGTLMTLLLPRAAALPQAGAKAALPAEPARSAQGRTRLRLLLAEDDEDVARLTAEMLRHLGHEVARVESGPAALKALRDGLKADLLLTDVVMPGGQDGLDLVRRLEEERPELPVLLYSGYGGAPRRVAATGLPLLRKPFTLEQLDRALTAAHARAHRHQSPQP
ncbi:MAG: PAS domain-containing protein [Acetobacteraceae bacterium]|nr:PAS domain-containing protein [Acetobacteraceae bacterium]